MSEKRPRFRTRSFISLLLLISAAGLMITGLMLEFHSEGLRAVRHSTEAIHSVLAFVFIITGVWHASCNRRAIASACQPAFKLRLASPEAAWATGIVFALLALFAGHTLVEQDEGAHNRHRYGAETHEQAPADGDALRSGDGPD